MILGCWIGPEIGRYDCFCRLGKQCKSYGFELNLKAGPTQLHSASPLRSIPNPAVTKARVGYFSAT